MIVAAFENKYNYIFSKLKTINLSPISIQINYDLHLVDFEHFLLNSLIKQTHIYIYIYI